MSKPKIKIVTRTCITCQHEPAWRPYSPVPPATLAGRCESNDFIGGFRPPFVTRCGQVASYENEPILDCPGWWPKGKGQ